jgi:hypothetical protein
MRKAAFHFTIASLLATTAFGQQLQEKTFRFNHIREVREIQEVATLIRAVGELKYLTTNTEQPSVWIKGTPAQIAMSEWLVTEVDSAPNKSPVTREYRTPGTADDIVRVFYLSDFKTPQELQEAATLVRAITEIPRLFTLTVPRAIVARGTAEQMKAAEWILPDFTRSGSDTVGREHRMTGVSEGVVRIFHLKPTLAIQELQEVATLVRSISEIRRLFTFNPTRAIAVRGTPEQIQLAQWLVTQLDKPAASTSAPGDFRMLNGDIVKIFYLPSAESPAQLQQIAVKVRQTTAVPRLFTYNAPKAMAIRGTSTQIEEAARMVKELNP